jgi:hypothetical protein
MVTADDRRAPGAARTPFEGRVEVGGTLGPSFEARAINVSEEGMQLRTAYLPELGQQVTCRFDTDAGQTVIASGDVVWSQGGEAGGEFGIRFTDIDGDSVEPLKRACGVAAPAALGQPGSKVRLYIDGLASPMRAKVRDSLPASITVGSDLGFLQVGKHLELEDAQSGTKRPASIDRVDVAVEPSSQIPQLIVTLRYSDVPADVADPQNRASSRATYPPGDLAATEVPAEMKSAFSRHAASMGPAFKRLAQRTKLAAMLLIARRSTDEDAMPRRTTAPPPGGGLRSLGRRIVRGEAGASTLDDAEPTQPKRVGAKRRAAIGGAVLVTALTGAIALKHVHREAEPAAQTPAPSAAETVAAPVGAPVVAPSSAATVSATAVSQVPASLPSTGAEDSDESSHAANHKKHARPTPFANGPVHHGNILHLKMDGPIETIEGAQQPTGFTVKIPGHKSLEPAGPLAARDTRIAAIKVSNESSGAELSVTFKDGVPNYQVSARGESLVIALAAPGTLDTPTAKRDDTTAKRDDKAGKNHKPGTRERDTTPER